MSFAELGLNEPLLRAVSAQGYDHPTPIQAAAIPKIIEGSDLLGTAQTGTGKTAAFALPILHRLTAAGNPPRGQGRRIRVLILSPTRELCLQIGESFKAYGKHTSLRFQCVFGGVSQVPQVKGLRNGVDILIATPGRLVDLMNQGHIDLSSIEIFVLDEADRMLDIGFLPDIRRVIAKLPQQRQTLFFSATLADEVGVLANQILRQPQRVCMAPAKATADLIDQSVFFVAKKQKPELLVGLLNQESATRTIVFTKTKHGADRVARHLDHFGIRAEAMHGNKSQAARQRTLANFKSNRTAVLVATDVAARGIDVDQVSHVINFDLPHEPETYVHRIGRTGRAGAEGIAIAFCDYDERRLLQAVERKMRVKLRVRNDVQGVKPARPAKENAGVASPVSAETQQPQREHRPRPRKSDQPAKAKQPGKPRFDREAVAAMPERPTGAPWGGKGKGAKRPRKKFRFRASRERAIAKAQ